jgi:enoyl-CoA hydratase
MTDGTAQAASELRITIEGAMALVTLDRPRALNALTVRMRSDLLEGFKRFARDAQVYCVVIQSAHPKAFSAGSDVREVLALADACLADGRKAFRDEYALNWHHECFSKPTVSLINGMVMGGGVGISLYGTHRVAGEGYKFAMPETRIGLFPDVGTCHAFARMPAEIGVYLGLTGAAIGPADAYRLGLVTHVIPSAAFEDIKRELADVQPVDPVLDSRHVEPAGPGEVAARVGTISACFGAPTVAGILGRLEAVEGPDVAWARATAAELRTRSPLSLALTLAFIRRAKAMDLKETLETDYRLACRCLDGHDFREGVRAALVDKDNAPRWQPPRIEDVTEAMVDDYFRPLDEGELVLASRADMQAARA